MKVIRYNSSSCKFLHPTSCFWDNSLNQSICICIYLSLTLQFIYLLYIWLTIWSFTMQYVLEHTYKNFSSLEYEFRNGITSSMQCKLTRFDRFIAKADEQISSAIRSVRNDFSNLYLHVVLSGFHVFSILIGGKYVYYFILFFSGFWWDWTPLHYEY